MGQSDPFSFLGITVKGIKSKNAFAFKIVMVKKCVISAKLNNFNLHITIFEYKKPITKRPMGQNDPYCRLRANGNLIRNHLRSHGVQGVCLQLQPYIQGKVCSHSVLDVIIGSKS